MLFFRPVYIILLIVIGLSSCSTEKSDVVIVNIGNYNRPEIAKIIHTINENKPAMVGVDVIFSTDSGTIDSNLEAVLNNTKKLYKGGALIGNEGDFAEFPIGDFSLDKFGTNGKNVITNIKSNVRKEVQSILINGIETNRDQHYMNIAVEMYKDYTNQSPPLITTYSDDSTSVTTEHEFRIQEAHRFDNYTVIDGKDLLDNNYDSESIKDKLILVGFTGSPHLDRHFSQENLFYLDGQPYFGVEIHAIFLNMLLHYQPAQ